MKLAHDLSADALADPARRRHSYASWYAPGPSDELGDRLLMFDNSTAPSLELLRFRSSLTATPGFEVALRRRVERLSHFRHPAFAMVRGVEYLRPGDGLALLSNHTPGKRLSEILQDARGPAFATALIQQLTPALTSLQQHSEGGGHGALGPSRIVVTPEGRLTIVEHVLGPALERLQLSASRMRTEFGIAVPGAAEAHHRLDSKTDCFQLGLVALSLLLGHRISPDESQENIARLLEQVGRTAGRDSVLFQRLRVWLERALQLNDQGFESAGDAEESLPELAGAVPHSLASQPAVALAALTASGKPSAETIDRALSVPPSDAPARSAVGDVPSQSGWLVASHGAGEPTAALFPSEAVETGTETPSRDSEQAVEGRDDGQSEAVQSPAANAGDAPLTDTTPQVPNQNSAIAEPGRSVFVEIDRRAEHSNTGSRSSDQPAKTQRPPMVRLTTVLPRAQTKSRQDVLRALVFALVMCVIGEGFVIAGLILSRSAAAPPPAAVLVDSVVPGADVLVDGRSAGVTPLQLNIGAETRSIRVVDSRSPEPLAKAPQPESPPAVSVPARPDVGTTGVAAGAPQSSGGIRLLSPIDVEVFEGDKRLGSSVTGIVSAAAGRHEFELVNSALGYRTRQSVDVKGGQVVPVRVFPPNGRLSINAVPWAEVWIEGKSVGETPLGNLSVPLGEHEIVFRHPQLGEQRRTAVVRVDGVTRVSANLQR